MIPNMGFSLIKDFAGLTAKPSHCSPCARSGSHKSMRAPFCGTILSTKYWDEDTKLAYYGYRYYGPGVGRWLSRDPLGTWVGGKTSLINGFSLKRILHEMIRQSEYAYIGNDPIHRSDILGLLYSDGGETTVITAANGCECQIRGLPFAPCYTPGQACGSGGSGSVCVNRQDAPESLGITFQECWCCSSPKVGWRVFAFGLLSCPGTVRYCEGPSGGKKYVWTSTGACKCGKPPPGSTIFDLSGYSDWYSL